ncbi:MAG: amidohydrolase family protein [Deltaproteobacteria bacterium]|nr:amidohydrolase family protein [Deltaproteobacteria bacterium]
MKIDCHVHLVAMSQASGCRVSRRLRFFLRFLGVRGARTPEEFDRLYVEKLAAEVCASELDRVVLLALDRVHGEDGAPDDGRTDLFVSNDHAHSVVRRHRDVFLFGASVHPYRADALDELDRVASMGACLVKLLPNSQGFDPAAPRLRSYWRRLAELGMPALVHGGFEHTLGVIDQSFGDPAQLEPALDEGATVIVAHAGTAGLMHRRETLGAFLALLAKYPRCYGDTSALGNAWRAHYLRLLLDPDLLERRFGVRIDDAAKRLVHGSDHPIPITPLAFAGRIPLEKLRRVGRLENPLQKDVQLKRAAGLPDAALTRAYDEIGIGKPSAIIQEHTPGLSAT